MQGISQNYNQSIHPESQSRTKHQIIYVCSDNSSKLEFHENGMQYTLAGWLAAWFDGSFIWSHLKYYVKWKWMLNAEPIHCGI